MNETDNTFPPHRPEDAFYGTDSTTMPGARDRKPDGRFEVGDLILGRYKVLSELGQGGMGVVYKCFDETAGIIIALKALPPELSHNTLEMEDVKENYQLVYNLHHPNIANYNTLEKDNSNGNYYLVIECVEGEDLRRWIKRKRKEGSLTLETVLPVVRQVAAALDYAHEQKIVHRDIKPGNIMIDAAGHVKVLDFGLAAQIHTSMTRVSMAYHGTSGTAPYMAPEQWRGKPQGGAADQYALAVMTYEMLAGYLPFDSADAGVLREAVLNETPDPVPGIPAPAQASLERAMSKVPADRFASCAEFAAALGGEGKAAAPESKSKTDVLPAPTDAEAHPVNADAANSGKPSSVRFEHPGSASIPLQYDRTIVLPGNVKMDLVKVEAGSFEMSARDGENESDEVPHRATLTRDFYLAKTEVTQAQWRAVMGTNPSYFKGDTLPVEEVSWNDAMEFCEKLNASGKAPSGWKFTLPTETQWEYAARGGRKSRGYKYSGSDTLDEVAWYSENSEYKTHPVGRKKANELGLCDMSGNVWEWCLDDYVKDTSKLTAEFARGNDDGGWLRWLYALAAYGVLSLQHRAIRGGNWRWFFSDSICRVAARCSRYAGTRGSEIGFRPALVPEFY